MKDVYMARAHEWREDCLPLAIPCSLWEEVKHVKGPDLKFLFSDQREVSFFVSCYRSIMATSIHAFFQIANYFNLYQLLNFYVEFELKNILNVLNISEKTYFRITKI